MKTASGRVIMVEQRRLDPAVRDRDGRPSSKLLRGQRETRDDGSIPGGTDTAANADLDRRRRAIGPFLSNERKGLSTFWAVSTPTEREPRGDARWRTSAAPHCRPL